MSVFTRGAPAQAPPVSVFRPLVAAAQRLEINNKAEVEKLRLRRAITSKWQALAWDYYDAIGEIKYGFGMLGSLTSRVRLYIGYNDGSGEVPVPARSVEGLDARLVSLAEKQLYRLSYSLAGAPGIIRDAIINLSIAGECYLVQTPAGANGNRVEEWRIRSVEEIVINNDGTVRLRVPGGKMTDLEPHAFVGRIWRPHSRYSDDADSSMRGVLEACEELLLLSRLTRSTARSRLNAGALFVPDGLAIAAATPPDADDATTETETAFEEELLDAMVTPIQDEDSASSVVPLIIRGPSELGEKLRYMTFERSYDATLASRSDRVLERIMQGIDIPKDIVSGLANVRYCVDQTTQALTPDRGWVTHDQLSVGDTVLTLNHETGLSEWQPVTAMNVFPVENEPVVEIHKRNHSSVTTLAHRWPVLKGTKSGQILREWTTTGDLRGNEAVILAVPHAQLPTVPKYSDELVELIAWTFTEGCFGPEQMTYGGGPKQQFMPEHWDAIMSYKDSGFTQRKVADTLGTTQPTVSCVWSGKVPRPKTPELRPRRSWLSIGQSKSANPDKHARIERCLRSLYGDPFKDSSNRANKPRTVPTWWANGYLFMLNTEAAAPIKDAFEDTLDTTWTGKTTSAKIPSREFLMQLTQAQLELFLDVSRLGDGTGSHIFQKHPGRLEAYEFACVLAGKPFARKSRDGQETLRTNILQHSWTGLGSQDPQAGKNGSKWLEHRSYTGVVWCPTTPNSTWLARRNGTVYYTGNSNAVAINESLMKAHVEPLILMLVDALSMMFLRPALESVKTLDYDEIQRLMVWYDPSPILTRTDRGQDANDGFDRYAISADAWRRAHGFNEEDSPSGVELAQRIAIGRSQMTPELTEAVFRSFVPEMMDTAQEANTQNSPAPIPPDIQQMLQGGTPQEGAPA